VPPDIIEALESIPEHYARALRLRLLGLGIPEIATVLGIPEKAVRPLLRVADSKFVAALDNTPEVYGPASTPNQGEGE
jgi:DNA-directed RNA polymerase specialized sigma24 family protein